jgi:hypothetical protein
MLNFFLTRKRHKIFIKQFAPSKQSSVGVFVLLKGPNIYIRLQKKQYASSFLLKLNILIYKIRLFTLNEDVDWRIFFPFRSVINIFDTAATEAVMNKPQGRKSCGSVPLIKEKNRRNGGGWIFSYTTSTV